MLSMGYQSRGVYTAIFFACLVTLLLLVKSQSGPTVSWSKTIYQTASSGTVPSTKGKGLYTNTRFDGGDDLLSFSKPPLRISAIILAGRQAYVSILNCYLQRNLVRNGGMLDEVLWVIRTDIQSDLDYLHGLVDSIPEYVSYEPLKEERAYDKIYAQCRSDTIYIKIDDDVVFFEDHAIPAIVRRLVENPQYSVVSANVMNQPALSWVHYHMNVVLPFAPELQPPADYLNLDESVDVVDWRPSKLPAWSGPQNFDSSFPMINPAPFRYHRWLRLAGDHDIETTPAGLLGEGKHEEYVANSTAFQSWTIAAQEHYSFLTHVENHELWRYKFDLWHYHFDRISINFIAFWGKDIVDHPVSGSDEHYLTITMPKKLKRPAVLDGTAMAVHFGFHRQVYGHGGLKGKALNDTDLVFRYKSFAQEFICDRPMGSYRP